MSKERFALLSVSDKTGLVELARQLIETGWALLASGGTGRALESARIPFLPVDQITGNPEAFDGRMKTISFQLEGGILFDRRNPAHVRQCEELGLTPIDMVVCNFYPFEQAIAAPDCTLTEAVEHIDVGGPTMVRAAAKNFQNVIVMTSPSQYDEVVRALREGGVSDDLRRQLAVSAFERLTAYDTQVSRYLRQDQVGGRAHREPPGAVSGEIRLQDRRVLRYGENPQQAGAYCAIAGEDDALGLHRFEQHQGKEISYNNMLDADAALHAIGLLGGDPPVAVIVKHTNPCGAAFGPDVAAAFLRAWEGDPLAAFGGIVALNRPVSRTVAETIGTERFLELLLAPSIDEEALRILQARKNLRVLTHPALLHPAPPHATEYRSVRGGMLVQDADVHELDFQVLPVPTKRAPDERQRRDLWMAWQLCRVSRSNAITLVREGMLVGNGVGQQDRLRSCRIAVEKAGERAMGACAASDAFFPFPDGPEVLARAGVGAIVHPGGSIRDRDTIERMDELGVAVVLTGGVRCFRH